MGNVSSRILFPCHQTWAIYKESKEIILSLEQCKLLRVFDAVSLQCLWLVIKETICSQGKNKVHDKVVFPSVAIPLNTLLAYLLRLWHTGIIVESTNVMPVHLPKAPRLRKNMSWKNTRLSNSTKRLYDTAFGK